MQEILNDFWLTSDPIDLEYKKYKLLAYQQKFKKEYQNRKLYPYLTDIVNKLEYVNDFLNNMNDFEKSAQAVDHIDWVRKEVIFKSKITEDSFDDIKKTATYSKAILVDLYTHFKNLYDEVDGSIVISGSRFSVFDKYDGFIQVKYDKGKKEKLLYYNIYKAIFPEPTFHLQTSKVSLKEFYKERYRKNVFDITLNDDFPAKETSIPVFRRKFLMHIMGNVIL